MSFLQQMRIRNNCMKAERHQCPSDYNCQSSSQYPNPGLNISAGVNYPDKKVPIPDTHLLHPCATSHTSLAWISSFRLFAHVVTPMS